MSTIKQLDDLDAFLMMLKLLLRIFLKFDEKNLIEYIFRFCELDRASLDKDKLMNRTTRLFKDRVEYLSDERFVHIKIQCGNLGLENLNEIDQFFHIIIQSNENDYFFFIKNNDKNSISIPIQIDKINDGAIAIKVIQITKDQFLNQRFNKTEKQNKMIYDSKVDLKVINLLKGFDLELKFDEQKQQFDLLKSDLKIKRDTKKLKTNLKNKFKSFMKRDFKKIAALKQKKILDTIRPDQLRIDFQINWSHFNPFDFANTDVSIKHQLHKHHQIYIDQHLKLLKYIFIRKIKQLNDSALVNQLLKDVSGFETFFGKELMQILEQNLFEGGLNRTDHLICIRQVIADLEKETNSNKYLQNINFKQLLDKKSEIFESSEFTFSLSGSTDEYLSFLIKPHENLNQPVPSDLPFKQKGQNDLDLHYLPTICYNKNFYFQFPFDFEKMKYQFLNDFDSTSEKV